MRNSHSDKGMKTLAEMDAPAESWTIAPIEYEQKLVRMEIEVNCPSCFGNGKCAVDKETGKPERDVLPDEINPGKRGYDYYGWMRWNREKSTYSQCPTCPPARDRYAQPTGRGRGIVKAMRDVEMMVGRVIWPAGTRFDSRFADADRVNVCVYELCSKSIIKSNRVPVLGYDSQGRPHGMWVGEDCARKFLPGTVTWKRKKDEVLEDNLPPQT